MSRFFSLNRLYYCSVMHFALQERVRQSIICTLGITLVRSLPHDSLQLQLMAWLISSYLLPWSLQMFAQLPLIPGGHFTQLYPVSFNLNLFCSLFMSYFLFAECFYSTQYLPRAKRYYNTTLVTAGDWR